LYVCGAYFTRKEQILFANSFIILGYVFFGATLALIDLQYIFHPTSDWLFITWSFVGLFVFFFFQSQILLILGMSIRLYGQFILIFELDVSLFLILIYTFGYFYFVYLDHFNCKN